MAHIIQTTTLNLTNDILHLEKSFKTLKTNYRFKGMTLVESINNLSIPHLFSISIDVDVLIKKYTKILNMYLNIYITDYESKQKTNISIHPQITNLHTLVKILQEAVHTLRGIYKYIGYIKYKKNKEYKSQRVVYKRSYGVKYCV